MKIQERIEATKEAIRLLPHHDHARQHLERDLKLLTMTDKIEVEQARQDVARVKSAKRARLMEAIYKRTIGRDLSEEKIDLHDTPAKEKFARELGIDVDALYDKAETDSNAQRAAYLDKLAT